VGNFCILRQLPNGQIIYTLIARASYYKCHTISGHSNSCIYAFLAVQAKRGKKRQGRTAPRKWENAKAVLYCRLEHTNIHTRTYTHLHTHTFIQYRRWFFRRTSRGKISIFPSTTVQHVSLVDALTLA
jgi:hypothetical protein